MLVKIIKNITKISAIILIIIILDIVFNFFIPDTVKKSIGITRNYSIRTAEFHHEIVPNINVNEFWGSNKYKVITNNFGMRSNENDNINIDLNQKYIGFMGDSFVYGSGIDYDEHFINKIKNYDLNLNLLNLGYVSYSPSIYYKRLKYFIEEKKIKFKKIFLFVDTSDIQDEGVFYRENKKGHIVRKWLSDEDNSKKLFKYKIKNYLQQNSFIYKFHQVLFLSSETDKSAECLKNKNQILNFTDYLDLERFSYGMSSDIQKKIWVKEGLDKVTNYLEKIKNLSIENNFELIMVYYPSPVEILKNFNFDKSMHYKLLYNWSNLNKVSFINTAYQFYKNNEGIDNYKENFILCDVHWNSNGHDIIASNIIKFLNEKNN